MVLNLSARDVSALVDALREGFTFLPGDITDALVRLSEVRADAAQRASFCAYDGGTLRVASAEDTVLAKLEWYKLAPSDRQWRDVQAILRVQDDALDVACLRQWAGQPGIAELKMSSAPTATRQPTAQQRSAPATARTYLRGGWRLPIR